MCIDISQTAELVPGTHYVLSKSAGTHKRCSECKTDDTVPGTYGVINAPSHGGSVAQWITRLTKNQKILKAPSLDLKVVLLSCGCVASDFSNYQ